MDFSKVVIFGAWKEGVSLYFEICKKADVVAFIDNNPKIQSQKLYGIEILSPDHLKEIVYDEIYISSTKRYQEMYSQLLEMGIDQGKIKIVFDSGKVKKDINAYEVCFKDKNDDYEQRWNELQNKYKTIQIYSFDASCIGETVARLWRILEEEALCDETVLRVFCPAVGNRRRICNKVLIELAGERICVISSDNIDFWRYVLDAHGNAIETINYNRHLYRGELPNRIVGKDYVFIKFRKEQIEFGKRKLAELGISGEYVCIMARTANYAKKTIKDKKATETNIAVHAFRDSDFYEYRETIDYFESVNIQTVRVGRGEEPITNIDNCIDYAGGNADDFMDLFLMANCKLMIVGGGSGIYSLATSFAKPVLFVNIVPVTFGNGGTYFTENDLYIPKKMIWKSTGIGLSLSEMADVDKRSMHNGLFYDKNGVKFIDNTSAEILEAVQEVMDRIVGKWTDSEDDIKLLRRYDEILAMANRNLKKDSFKYIWAGGALPIKISINYLKKNLYLLGDL